MELEIGVREKAAKRGGVSSECRVEGSYWASRNQIGGNFLNRREDGTKMSHKK